MIATGTTTARGFFKIGVVTAAAMVLATMRLADAQVSGSTPTTIVLDQGHAGDVKAIAYAPNGRFVLTASDDNKLKLWDVDKGRVLRTFAGREETRSADFSSDGLQVIANGDVWDVETGRQVRTLEGLAGWVVGFAPDRKAAAAADHEGTVRVWDVSSGRLLHRFGSGMGQIAAIALSSDAKLLAAGGEDKVVRLYDLASGKLLSTLSGEVGLSGSIRFAPDGRHVSALGGEMFTKTLSIWDTANGRLVRAISDDFDSFAFTPDSKSIVTTGNGVLKVWNAQTGATQRQLKLDGQDQFSLRQFGGGLAVSPDGSQILASDSDGGLVLFDVPGNRKIKDIAAAPGLKPEAVLAIALSRDGGLLASVHHGGFLPGGGPPDKSIKLWDARSGRIVATLAGHTSDVNALAMSSDGALLVSAGTDRMIKLWDPRTHAEVRTIRYGEEGDDSEISAVALTPDSRVVIGGGRKMLKAWETATGREIRSFEVAENIHSVAVSPDGRTLLTSDGRKIKLIEVDTGRLVRTFDGLNWPLVAFSPDGRRIVGGGTSTLAIWDAETGEPVTTFARPSDPGLSSSFTCAEFTADGTRIVAASSDGALKIFDIANGRVARTLEPVSDAITSCAVSSDGRLVYAGTKGGEIGIWSAADGARLATLVSAVGSSWVAITPEGAFAASGDEAEFLTATRGLVALDPAELAQTFRQPDLVAEKIAGDRNRKVEEWWIKLNPGVPRPTAATARIGAAAPTERPPVTPYQGVDRLALVTNIAHSEGVTALAVSPDGAEVVTAAGDNSIRLWDTASGRLLRTLAEASSIDVATIAYTPNGENLIAGGRDGGLRMWSVQTGRVVREFKGHDKAVRAVAVSPDGKRLVSGGEDKAVRVWDIATAALVHRIELDDDTLQALAYLPDNRHVAAALNGKVVVLDVTTGERIRSMSNGQVFGPNESIAVSPQGDLIATGQFRRLDLWDVNDGLLRSVAQDDLDAQAVAFAPDGAHVITGGRSGDLRIWDARNGRAVAKLKTGADDFTRVLALMPDGRHLVAAGSYGARLWDTETGEQVRTFGTPVQSVSTVAFTSDGRRLISGGAQSLWLWDLAAGELAFAYPPQPNYIEALALSSDDKSVLAVHRQRTVRLVDVATGKELLAINEPLRSNPAAVPGDPLNEMLTRMAADQASWLQSGSVSPDRKLIAVGGNDETVKIWDAATGKLVRTLRGHRDMVLFAVFSPDGRRIASGGADRTVKLWNAETGALIRTLSGHRWTTRAAAFSSDGKLLLSASGDTTMMLWDTDTGAPIRTFEGHRAVVRSVAWSPDGKYAVSGSFDTTVKVWEIATGRIVWSADAHASPVVSVAYSPDGRLIASGSEDGTVKLWSAANGAPVATLIASRDGEWIVLTPEGFFAASRNGAGKLSVVRGARAFGLDRFTGVLNRPDLVRAKLAGDVQGTVHELATKLDLEAILRQGR